MVRLALLLALSGCGRIGFTARSTDAPADAECTWSPFSTPIALPGPVQSPDDDWSPTPTLGGLELYFFSYRAGSQGADIWYATRDSLADQFGTPVQASELDTTANEGAPTLSDDAVDIVFERDDPSAGDLFEARRASTDVVFDAPVAVAALDTPSTEDDPFLSADGLRIVFASSRIGPDEHGLDVFESTRSSLDDTFTQPVELAPLDSDSDDFTPTLSADALDIFFASRRSGGPGGADIYTSHRTTPDQPFAAPTLVPELSSPLDDVGTRLSRDGSTMYLNYNTVTAGGANADLFFAMRSCD